MSRHVQPSRLRLRLEVALAVASLVLGLVALVWPEWIEAVFRVDPDAGSGSLEWAVAAVLLLLAAGAAVAARSDLRALRAASASDAGRH
jgi:hypothetical protein